MTLFTFTDLSDTVQVCPGKREVCPDCFGGSGEFDAWLGGLTASEVAELGQDFMADYRAGHYSVSCRTCNGANVVVVLDTTRATPEQVAAYNAVEEVAAENADIRRAEMAYLGNL